MMRHHNPNQGDSGQSVETYCLITAVEKIRKDFARQRRDLQAERDRLAVRVIEKLAAS